MDFVAPLAHKPEDDREAHTLAYKQTKSHPRTNSHASLTLLKLRSLLDFLFFFNLAAVTVVQKYSSFCSTAKKEEKKDKEGHCWASIPAS